MATTNETHTATTNEAHSRPPPSYPSANAEARRRNNTMKDDFHQTHAGPSFQQQRSKLQSKSFDVTDNNSLRINIKAVALYFIRYQSDLFFCFFPGSRGDFQYDDDNPGEHKDAGIVLL